MRVKLFIMGCIFIFLGCNSKEDIIYNTTVSPDLSNPLVQKLTATKWYRERLDTESLREIWVTENFNSAGEVGESFLYSFAWLDVQFLKDGTSLMSFKPPLFQNSFIVCEGKWMVSKTEENTILVETKTPVSYAVIRFKILNLESKDNVALMRVRLDTGSRVMETNLINNNIIGESDKGYSNPNDYNWLETKEVNKQKLDVSEFIGAWSNPNFQLDPTKIGERQNTIVSTYVDDLLMATPTFFEGMQFDLMEDGKARLAYGMSSQLSFMFPKAMGKQLYSDATWKVEGNKVIIESTEHLFYAVGVNLGFTVANKVNLKPISEEEESTQYFWKKYYYILELIEKEQDAWLFRVTSNDAIHYVYLKKSEIDYESHEWLNVKEVYN